MMAPRGEILSLADMGAIIPITEYVKRDKLDLSIFYPAEVEAFRYEGELWTLPLPTVTANDDFYFYNKELFEEAGLNADRPPETWTSFMTIGQKLTRLEPDGRISQLFSRMAPHQYLDFLFSNNGNIVTSDLRRQAIDSQESKDTLQFMYDYAAKVNGGTKQSDFLTRNNPKTGMAFMSGKEVVLFENISMMNLFIDEMKKGNMFDWGVGLIPYNGQEPEGQVDRRSCPELWLGLRDAQGPSKGEGRGGLAVDQVPDHGRHGRLLLPAGPAVSGAEVQREPRVPQAEPQLGQDPAGDGDEQAAATASHHPAGCRRHHQWALWCDDRQYQPKRRYQQCCHQRPEPAGQVLGRPGQEALTPLLAQFAVGC